jgi:uroporphyrin-3 C-methyltransferase
MSEDIQSGASGVTESSVARAVEVRAIAPRRGGGIAWLIALLALIVAGFALWRVLAIEHNQAGAVDVLRSELSARIDELAHNAVQRKRDIDSLSARVSDTDRVDKTERDQLLSLNERSRHLEQAVANLAEQRLSSRDAMARSDAEFLLQQASQRLLLFHDANAAIAAYQLADSTLAATDDPVFAAVREMIKGELDSLEASKPLQTQATLAALERVGTAVATLPTHRAATSVAAPASRWQNFIGQFVHITHGGAAEPFEREPALTRALVALDLREAEAALLARDVDAYKKALARAQTDIDTGFDATSASAKSALVELRRLASQPLAPAVADLGGALRELRNLHVTRALADPAPAPHADAAAPAAPPPADETDR